MKLANCVYVISMVLIQCGNFAISSQCSKCHIMRAKGLRSADCYNQDMKEFPRCLGSIEAAELSYNRIRKVSKDDLELYPNLVHLYLTDNLIVNIKDDTFAPLTNLETLDLSLNGLTKVPSTIFQMPSLKTLYLGNNKNINIAESIDEARPISKSRLTKLDISYLTDEQNSIDFPNFTGFYLLAYLNISGNQFNYLTLQQFAVICNLQLLANTNVTTQFNSNCDCWKLNRWLMDRNVKFTFFNCPVDEKYCVDDITIASEDLEEFNNCQRILKDIDRAEIMRKVWWIGGIVVAIVVVLVAATLYVKWTKRQRDNVKASEMSLRERSELLSNGAAKAENIYVY